jgi:triacylglycerol lipase
VHPLDPLRIPISREGLVALERAALARDPVWRGDGVPRGRGEPVLLIPGFLAGDSSLAPMARWLRRIGYRPCRAGIRANVDCTSRSLHRLETQLERLVAYHECGVTIVGQSRGGSMARILAVRRPELVDRIVCLGSPLTDEFAVHPFVLLQVHAVAMLGSIGLQGVFSRRCRDHCCVQARRDLLAQFPADVGFTSVYSRSDGVVDWGACLDPAARLVEVRSTHVGMSVNPAVFEVLAGAIAASPEDEGREFEPRLAVA